MCGSKTKVYCLQYFRRGQLYMKHLCTIVQYTPCPPTHQHHIILNILQLWVNKQAYNRIENFREKFGEEYQNIDNHKNCRVDSHAQIAWPVKRNNAICQISTECISKYHWMIMYELRCAIFLTIVWIVCV
jgi:hypothetical protein